MGAWLRHLIRCLAHVMASRRCWRSEDTWIRRLMAWHSGAHENFLRELSDTAGLSRAPWRRRRKGRPLVRWEALLVKAWGGLGMLASNMSRNLWKTTCDAAVSPSRVPVGALWCGFLSAGSSSVRSS